MSGQNNGHRLLVWKCEDDRSGAGQLGHGRTVGVTVGQPDSGLYYCWAVLLFHVFGTLVCDLLLCFLVDHCK